MSCGKKLIKAKVLWQGLLGTYKEPDSTEILTAGRQANNLFMNIATQQNKNIAQMEGC
jgi:hypothetical protein